MLKLVLTALLSSGLALVLFASTRGGGATCSPASNAQTQALDNVTVDRELFFAVLEGLYTDGVANEVVDAVIAKDPEHGYPANFVWGCPVCMPAYRAFVIYRARPEHIEGLKGDTTLGDGLDAATTQRITRGSIADRQQALMELVGRWLARRLDAHRLTPEERAAWRSEMEMRRKKGMALLQQYQQEGLKGSYAQMKGCPFCDGANRPFRTPFDDK